MNNLRILLILLLIAVFAGCKPQIVSEKNSHQFNNVVATADNDYSLTMNDLYQKLYHSRLLRKGGVVDTSQIRNFLDSVVVDTLMGFVADTIPLEDYYIEHRLYKLRYNDVLIKKYLKTFVYDMVSVDSEKVVEYYNAHPELFAVKEQANIWHILLSDVSLLMSPDSMKYKNMTPEERDKDVEALAWKIRKEVSDSTTFANAARKYSEDISSGSIGGYVGWIPRDTYMPPFDSIAFAMRPGDISDPYKDNSGWHILFCSGYYADGIPPLTERMYQTALKTYSTVQSNEIGKQLLDTLFSHPEVVFNDTLLDKDPYQVDGQEWIAIINGKDTVDVNEARTIELNYRKKYSVPFTNAEQKKEMLNKLAQKYILIQAARATKLDTLPDIIKQEQFFRHKYQRVLIEQDRYEPAWEPSDTTVEAYYNTNIDQFSIDKPLTLQHIVVQDSAYGEYLRDLAMSGYDFLDLAEENYPGDKSIRRELADLGEIGPGDMPEAFYKAALMVPVGEVTHPVKTEFGYHIIKVLKHEESETLDKARHKILSTLKKEHKWETFHAYRNMLYMQYHVHLSDDLYPMHLKPLKMRIVRDTTSSEG